MQDNTMQSAMDAFILRRVNACGSRETEALQDAFAQLKGCSEKLKEGLSSEQTPMFIDCENAYALVEGETMQCYYRAGFSDAVLFLLGWRDGEWN